MSRWKTGKVKWFDHPSGWGIISDKEGEEYDVHYSSIKSKKKIRSLNEDQQVKFKPIDDPDFKLVAEVKENPL